MKKHVLVIEDHPAIVQNIADFLDPERFGLDVAGDGMDGLAMARRGGYDAIILDLMLPGLDGVEVCRTLRRTDGIETPILMLTARDTLPDKLEGFRAGTDDYLTKPFALEELEVRLTALSRRGGGRRPHALRVGDVILDPATRSIHRRGRSVEASPTGFRILHALLRAYPNVVPREELEEALWQDQPPGSDSLRTHLAALRKVLEKPFDAPFIQTLYGVGFRIRTEDETAS